MGDSELIIVFCFVVILLIIINSFLINMYARNPKNRILKNSVVFIPAIQVFLLFGVILMNL